MNTIKIEDFFNNEFPNFAMYNLYRMVASYVDGLKPSQRKIIHTVMQHNIKKPIKVSQLAAKTSEYTQYLHGEVNLQGVIVNMVQDFSGTNNMNVLYPESSFGNRCFPQAAAARYIFTRKSDIFDVIYHKDDTELLPEQYFEGDKIEPKYFVPVLPMILVNGSEGIGSGWSQKILPRNPKDIKKQIKNYLANKTVKQIKPFFKDFKGTVNHVENNTWELRGVLEQKNLSTFEITEIPPNISLDKFTSYLVKLEDDNVITSFTDFSDPGTNTFLFEIKTKRSFSENLTHEQIMKKFHLIKRVTENFTCMDENNKVIEFKNDTEILERYCKIRLHYYIKRKKKLIQNLEEQLNVLNSKCKFIEHIIKNKLKIKDLTKKQIQEYLINNNFKEYKNSFNYLINMPIYVISKDEYNKLKKETERINLEIDVIKSTDVGDMWVEDLRK